MECQRLALQSPLSGLRGRWTRPRRIRLGRASLRVDPGQEKAQGRTEPWQAAQRDSSLLGHRPHLVRLVRLQRWLCAQRLCPRPLRCLQH